MYKRAYFLCCATYHLTVALYYAMQVNWENTEKILVWQNNTNAVVDKELLEKNFDTVIYIRGRDLVIYPFLEQQRYKIVNAGWLFRFSKIGKMLHEMPNGNAVFLFNDTTRLTDKVVLEFGKRESNKIILVEEGTGTYHYRQSKLNIKTRIGNLLCGQKAEPFIGANPYIDTVIARNVHELPDYQTSNRRTIQQSQLFFDSIWTKKLIEIVKESLDLYIQNGDKKVALWIGEPLSPSLISAEKENEILDFIFAEIAKKYVVLVKMHPREDRNKYDSFSEKYSVEIIIDERLSWFPVEILANVINPDIVLTPLSSALNGIMPSIKAAYCYKLFQIETSNRNITDLIKRRENTYIIDNKEEVDDILEKDTIDSDNSKGFGINTDQDMLFIQNNIVE